MASAGDFLIEYLCPVCGSQVSIDSKAVNFREYRACKVCRASKRTSDVARQILRFISSRYSNLRDAEGELGAYSIYLLESYGPLFDVLKRCPLFNCSEYFDDVEPGGFKDGVRSEDVQRLTFPNDVFDFVISQDVFEHVPDYKKGFSEVYRVLKPGGVHIFTIPYRKSTESTVIRAELQNGELVHHLQPNYHKDKLRSDGVLVFTDFGRDISRHLRENGCYVEVIEESYFAFPKGGYNAIFLARKPHLCSGDVRYIAEYVHKIPNLRSCKQKHLIYPFDYDGMADWFSSFGATDLSYLKAHFKRFSSTYEFAKDSLPSVPIKILDIGAHWLHQAFFFSNGGHEVIAIDASPTFTMPSVKGVANELGITLIRCKNLDHADGFKLIPDNSVAMVLFCEVIEHLTFNPIRMWKEIYRILSPAGRIIVTTPNVYYHASLRKRMANLVAGRGMGVSVEEIFSFGTRGHHWKEFSAAELEEYFSILSADFKTTRLEYVNTKISEKLNNDDGIEYGIANTVNMSCDTILHEVILREKQAGIVIKAPWETD